VVEVMAVGVPVVATPDAVFGMGLTPGRGLFLHETDEALANQCLALLHDPAELAAQSRLARQQVEETFSFQATYARLAQALRAMVRDV
jgi:glycosyltransferase involved in cell wall biosynthesis